MSELRHVFVYGTLKTGQCREKCWPVAPVSISPAWTVGELYDLGPYPALTPGNSRIAGQIWSFHSQDIPTVTKVLDWIEVTNQPGVPNEYDRLDIKVFTLDNLELAAQTYMFSNPELLKKTAKLVPASHAYLDHKYAVWPVSSSWPE